MKYEAICQLERLEGVKKELIDAVFIKRPVQLNEILKQGFAATAAGGNGAINIWRDDKGVIHTSASRYCIRLEHKEHPNLLSARTWIKDWFKQIF